MLRSLAALLIVAVAGLSGCGGKVIDTTKIEETLRHNLEAERGEKVSSVDCPSEVKVVPKTTFECAIDLASGKKKSVTLEIRDDEADVSVVGVSGEAGGSNE